MQLSFAASLEGAPPLAKWAPVELSVWAEEQRPPAYFLSQYAGSEVNGFKRPRKLGGVMIHPARTVLGLRAWDDAHESVLSAHPPKIDEDAHPQTPYVLFDLEKIIRMMLHQSGLALEILASPIRLKIAQPEALQIPAYGIINAALTRDILDYYWSIARNTIFNSTNSARSARADELLNAARHALTGWMLSQGVVEFSLPRLLKNCEFGQLIELIQECLDISGAKNALVSADRARALSVHIERLIESVDPAKCALAENPAGYDWLNDLVVERRLAAEQL